MLNINIKCLHHYIALSVFLIVLYKWHYSFVLDVLVACPKFTLLNQSTETAITTDVYEQLIDIQKFTFLFNPRPCEGLTNGLLLLAVVSSRPSNFDHRAVIRNTWGRQAPSMRLVFLLGQVDDKKLQRRVFKEASRYQDIVLGSFMDSYRNLTYKHVMGLKWVRHHCPTARYILKTDDDITINIQYLRKFLVKDLSPFGARDLILCPTKANAVVLRDWTKWAVSKKEYPGDRYPLYCLGYVILYSQDVVEKILVAAQRITYFWIDDVHLTGTVAKLLGIHRTDVTPMGIKKADLYSYTAGRRFSRNFLFGAYNMDLNSMKSLWYQFHTQKALKLP